MFGTTLTETVAMPTIWRFFCSVDSNLVVHIVNRTAPFADGAAQIKLKGNFDQSSILCLEYSIFTAFWGIPFYALNDYLLISLKENQLKLKLKNHLGLLEQLGLGLSQI